MFIKPDINETENQKLISFSKDIHKQQNTTLDQIQTNNTLTVPYTYQTKILLFDVVLTHIPSY